MIGGFDLRCEELRAAIEILEPHQRADALVQRMLVSDHWGTLAGGEGCQSGILPEVASANKVSNPQAPLAAAANAR